MFLTTRGVLKSACAMNVLVATVQFYNVASQKNHADDFAQNGTRAGRRDESQLNSSMLVVEAQQS